MSISKSIFREYDIRGLFEKELNRKSVKLIGYAIGRKISGNKVVAIGYDARSHSTTLKDYLTSGLNAAGCTVLDMGMVATPVNYFANYVPLKTLHNDFRQGDFLDGSIMITGSHNPKQYNGFKITLNRLPFFGNEIQALCDEVIALNDMSFPDNAKSIEIDVRSHYINYMTKEFSFLTGTNILTILDAGNGVADTVLTEIFDKLSLRYEGLYLEPDGQFPNHHPDPSEEKNLEDIKSVLRTKGDIAFAYDGDADRIAVLTKTYNIKGDQLALLFTKFMEKSTIIGEVKCSQVMYDELERRGFKTIMYRTGHSNLKKKLKEESAYFACEVSGHIFFNDRYFGYDDAIYATLRVLELIHRGMDINEEIKKLPKTYVTEESKIAVSDEKKFLLIEKIKEILKTPSHEFPLIKKIIDIDGVRIHFEYGWVLVRASNTTPMITTRCEAYDADLLKYYEKQLYQLIFLAEKSI